MCAKVERPIPQTKWCGRLHALPREGLASIWLGSRSQNPQLATAGPVSSFLFHLPAAGLLTNKQLPKSGRPLGVSGPGGVTPATWQCRSRLNAWCLRCSPANSTCEAVPASRRHALKAGRQATEFQPPDGGHPLPRSSLSPGDRALTAPRREPPKAPCASGSRLAFRKALSTPPKSEKPQPPQAHLCAGGVQGVAGRRHPCTESKHCGEGD